jgi:hypothetical protein
VRDKNHPSHPETPVYKGVSEENVRDDGFLQMNLFEHICRNKEQM